MRISIPFNVQKVHWSLETKICIQTYFPLLSLHWKAKRFGCCLQVWVFRVLLRAFVIVWFLSSFLHPQEWYIVSICHLTFSKSTSPKVWGQRLPIILSCQSHILQLFPSHPLYRTFFLILRVPRHRRPAQPLSSPSSSPGFANLHRGYLWNLMTQLGFTPASSKNEQQSGFLTRIFLNVGLSSSPTRLCFCSPGPIVLPWLWLRAPNCSGEKWICGKTTRT